MQNCFHCVDAEEEKVTRTIFLSLLGFRFTPRVLSRRSAESIRHDFPVIINRWKLANASLLRNQNLLHPRNKRGLDIEQPLNDSFGLLSRNVVDI